MTYPLKRRRVAGDKEQAVPTPAPSDMQQQAERNPLMIDQMHSHLRRYLHSSRSHHAADAHSHINAMHHRRQTDVTDVSVEAPPVTSVETPAAPEVSPPISVSIVTGADGLPTPITWILAPTTTAAIAEGSSADPSSPVVGFTVTEIVTEVIGTPAPSSAPEAPVEAPVPTTEATSPSAEAPTPYDLAPPNTTETPTATDVPVSEETTPPATTTEPPVTVAPDAAPTSSTTDLASTGVPAAETATNTTLTDTASMTSTLDTLSTPPSIPSNATMTDSITGSVTSSASTITAAPSLSSSDVFGLLGFLVTTHPDGQVSTIPATRSAFVTTLPNGEVSTSWGSLIPVTTESSGATGSSTGAVPTSTGGANGNGGLGSATTAGSDGSASNSNESGSSAPPPQILAGGIVGGVAGIAAIVLVAFILLRWYRRKSSMDRLDDGPSGGSGSRQMAERKGLLPLALSGGAFFRGSKDQGTPTNERGFQRISGRKLPSAYSPGMTGPSGPLYGTASPPPVPMPAVFQNSNGHTRHNGGSGDSGGSVNRSFYRDSTGYYGGVGMESSSTGTSPDDPSPFEVQPGPARQATVHPGGPYSASTNPFDTPPGSPRMPMLEPRSATPDHVRAAYPRNETPLSHYSRFTEEV